MFARIATAFCLTISLPMAAFAQAAASDTKPIVPQETGVNMLPPATGDHWTYEIRDNISGDLKGQSTQTVTDIKGDEISIQSHALGAPHSVYLVYDRFWDLKSNPLWRFAPSDGSGIKDSMKVGEVWNFKTTDLRASRAIWKRTGSSKVVSEEAVSTQAGTFNAVKYETTVHIRNAIDPTKKAEAILTTWYAPSVDHWVKRSEKVISNGHVRNNTTVELVDYGRQ